jgi:hypothetical protein
MSTCTGSAHVTVQRRRRRQRGTRTCSKAVLREHSSADKSSGQQGLLHVVGKQKPSSGPELLQAESKPLYAYVPCLLHMLTAAQAASRTWLPLGRWQSLVPGDLAGQTAAPSAASDPLVGDPPAGPSAAGIAQQSRDLCCWHLQPQKNEHKNSSFAVITQPVCAVVS